MDQITLGKTGIIVNKNGFGALPIQRISMEEATILLKKAYRGGITFFDTALPFLILLDFIQIVKKKSDTP